MSALLGTSSRTPTLVRAAARSPSGVKRRAGRSRRRSAPEALASERGDELAEAQEPGGVLNGRDDSQRSLAGRRDRFGPVLVVDRNGPAHHYPHLGERRVDLLHRGPRTSTPVSRHGAMFRPASPTQACPTQRPLTKPTVPSTASIFR